MSSLHLSVLTTVCLATAASTPGAAAEPPSAAAGGRCSLQLDRGPCPARIPRFFFNATSSRCEQFDYGGCGGNGNNFETLSACAESCAIVGSGRCFLPPYVGPCRASIPRFFFNATSARCERFIYGGCGENSNNFKSDKECQIVCGDSKVDKCSLPPARGSCEAAFPRLFFNSTSGACESFVFGGCGGNENNFKTSAECSATCKASKTNRCSLPPAAGPCHARFSRFFFNDTSGVCERFVYGGCHGNQNNFEYATDCMLACSRGYVLDLFTLSSLSPSTKLDIPNSAAVTKDKLF